MDLEKFQIRGFLLGGFLPEFFESCDANAHLFLKF